MQMDNEIKRFNNIVEVIKILNNDDSLTEENKADISEKLSYLRQVISEQSEDLSTQEIMEGLDNSIMYFEDIRNNWVGEMFDDHGLRYEYAKRLDHCLDLFHNLKQLFTFNEDIHEDERMSTKEIIDRLNGAIYHLNDATNNWLGQMYENESVVQNYSILLHANVRFLEKLKKLFTFNEAYDNKRNTNEELYENSEVNMNSSSI